MKEGDTIQLGDLCRRIGVPVRMARYLTEQGLLPRGVDPAPERGHHRQLTAGQAYWLALTLMLKQSGVQAPAAAQVTAYAEETVKMVARNLNWDPWFNPFQGRLETEKSWFVEVADMKFIRIVVFPDPSGRRPEFPWSPLGVRRNVTGVEPVVMIRIDLARLARLLLRPSDGGAADVAEG
jgi:hypothetical protein